MEILFEITNHAIERYIERKKNITSKTEIKKMLENNRDELALEISKEVMESDFIYTDYRGNDSQVNSAHNFENTIYFINKNIIYIVVNGHIRTIITTQVSDPEEIKTVKSLIAKHRKNEGSNSIQARNYAMVLIGHTVLQGII